MYEKDEYGNYVDPVSGKVESGAGYYTVREGKYDGWSPAEKSRFAETGEEPQVWAPFDLSGGSGCDGDDDSGGGGYVGGGSGCDGDDNSGGGGYVGGGYVGGGYVGGGYVGGGGGYVGGGGGYVGGGGGYVDGGGSDEDDDSGGGGVGACGCLLLILAFCGEFLTLFVGVLAFCVLFGGDCGQDDDAVVTPPGSTVNDGNSDNAQETGPFDLATKAGEQTTLVINGVEFTFIWCPPGEFEMGSPVSEPGRYDWENRRRVTLTSGFWLLAVETTQEMWRAGNGSSSATTLEPYTGARKPASNVSWFDCQEFVESLNASGFAPKGWRFALPTEAQWEYACRAGSTDMYSPSGVYGNLSECCWYDDPQGAPRDVARKIPNAWGFYDMHGNVYEWCGDWFAESYCGTTVDPSGPTTGTYRVLRGGAWGSEARHCRSANRYSHMPSARVYSHGFRLALVRDGE